jgi:hypothetical protein
VRCPAEKLLLDLVLNFPAPLVEGITESTARLQTTQDTAITGNIRLARVLLLKTLDFRRGTTGKILGQGGGGPFSIRASATEDGARVTSNSDLEIL